MIADEIGVERDDHVGAAQIELGLQRRARTRAGCRRATRASANGDQNVIAAAGSAARTRATSSITSGDEVGSSTSVQAGAAVARAASARNCLDRATTPPARRDR